jgi:hypothetical protein
MSPRPRAPSVRLRHQVPVVVRAVLRRRRADHHVRVGLLAAAVRRQAGQRDGRGVPGEAARGATGSAVVPLEDAGALGGRSPQPDQVRPRSSADPSPDSSMIFGSVFISPAQLITGVVQTVKSVSGGAADDVPAGVVAWLVIVTVGPAPPVDVDDEVLRKINAITIAPAATITAATIMATGHADLFTIPSLSARSPGSPPGGCLSPDIKARWPTKERHATRSHDFGASATSQRLAWVIALAQASGLTCFGSWRDNLTKRRCAA